MRDAAGRSSGGPPRYRPMLAVSGPVKGDEAAYAFEPKWDGWRVIVEVGGGGVTVRTRTGRDISSAVPELAALAATCPAAVLDGELVAQTGAPDSFYRIGGRVAARRATADVARRTTPLTFVCFDLLELDAVPLVDEAYRDRRRTLEGLALLGPAWCTSPSYVGMGAEVYAACVQLGLEGLVAKRLDGRYYPGERRNVWVKAKCEGWLRDHAPHRHER